MPTRSTVYVSHQGDMNTHKDKDTQTYGYIYQTPTHIKQLYKEIQCMQCMFVVTAGKSQFFSNL